MSDQRIPVITIDGPSGTGKGTVAHMLAKYLQWHMLDSGALYRVVAVGAESQHISYEDIPALCEFARTMDVQFSTLFSGSIVLGQDEISDQVRLEESGAKASFIAVIPELRAALMARQRAFCKAPGLVADGRDMGTVVFPDAVLKIFLTASAGIRADRRYKQLINKGVGVNLRDLLHNIEERDRRDSSRSVAPLVAAQDAIVIDTDQFSAQQVFEKIRQESLSRLSLNSPGK